MKIIHKYIESEIEISPCFLNMLIIEDPTFLYNFIVQLEKSILGDEEDINICSDGNTIGDTKKIYFLNNIFNIDFNNRIIQNALAKKLFLELQKKDYVLREAFSNIIQIVEESTFAIDSLISLKSDLDISQLIKLFAPTIEDDFNSALERIVNFIDTLVEFTGLKYIIFLNLQSFLGKTDIEKLFQHCQYKEVAMLLIESTKRDKIREERCLIIDKDLCEIIL